MKRYLFGIAALLSQAANHLLLYPWGGHHDMTISAHCYIKRHKAGWREAYYLINAIFFWQGDHCYSSFLQDVLFANEVMKLKDEKL